MTRFQKHPARSLDGTLENAVPDAHPAVVAEAQRSRAPIQKLVDLVASYFVPAVVLIAIITFVVWTLVGNALRLRSAEM